MVAPSSLSFSSSLAVSFTHTHTFLTHILYRSITPSTNAGSACSWLHRPHPQRQPWWPRQQGRAGQEGEAGAEGGRAGRQRERGGRRGHRRGRAAAAAEEHNSHKAAMLTHSFSFFALPPSSFGRAGSARGLSHRLHPLKAVAAAGAGVLAGLGAPLDLTNLLTLCHSVSPTYAGSACG